MQLTAIEVVGFKSFGKKTLLPLTAPVTAIVGPNGSGKSNVAEAFRFVLGEQSMKSMRGKSGSDLIFKGSAKSPQLSRASVTLTFDNKQKLAHRLADTVYGSFDEIAITREIYADGANDYLINGTKVRLKDITELLTKCNVGSTSHHIISQGEADRILHSSDKERKEMIEDALGLKLYQWRIKESDRKLIKTNENIREAEISRREIAPHLQFLKKQVEKINKATELRTELTELYHIYLAREEQELKAEKHILSSTQSSKELTHELAKTEKEIVQLEETFARAKNTQVQQGDIAAFESELARIRNEKDIRSRELGRFEAEISFAERTLTEQKTKLEKIKRQKDDESVTLPKAAAISLAKDIEESVTQALWRAQKHEYAELDAVLALLKTRVTSWITSLADATGSTVDTEELTMVITELTAKVHELTQKKKALETQLHELGVEETATYQKVNSAREAAATTKETSFEQEKRLFELKAHHNELRSAINLAELKELRLHERAEQFENELKEGAVLVGAVILEYKNASLVDSGITQDDLRRKIERIKIKLEDVGITNVDEVSKEFDQVKGRDEFLMNEMVDLEKSKASLEVLIADLKEKLAHEFENGITKINTNFSLFFKQMFNGGEAHLKVSKKEKRIRKSADEEEEVNLEMSDEPELEEGIEVSVSLPQKKVKDLAMLSGGERALTSIALLFAISQVNPPPFLILDETDAALDEANARKYGAMLKVLSEKTKLIVITHNRETMSQANVLYGVTVGAEGVSRVLSIQFEDASQFAK